MTRLGHNGGIFGTKVSSGGVRSIQKESRSNGGIIGPTRRSADLTQNVLKLSGIWNASGSKLSTANVSVTVDNGYFRQDPDYDEFVVTGQEYAGSGVWYPNAPGGEPANCGCPAGDTWCGGPSIGDFDSSSWGTIGGAGCDPWTFIGYTNTGYYITVTPPPVYVPVLVTTTQTYTVWDYYS